MPVSVCPVVMVIVSAVAAVGWSSYHSVTRLFGESQESNWMV